MTRPQSAALIRNCYFDELSATPGLYRLGQNTDHNDRRRNSEEAFR